MNELRRSRHTNFRVYKIKLENKMFFLHSLMERTQVKPLRHWAFFLLIVLNLKVPNWLYKSCQINCLQPFAGPISSSFVNRWGCQAVTVAGALLAATCVTASAFADNVLTLIFTIGIGTGFGCGLIYLPAIVSVTVWFERYRSLATGTDETYPSLCPSGTVI